MSEETKSKMEFIRQLFGTGNVALLDEYCTPNLVYHVGPFPDMNFDQMKQFITGFHMAFPDFDGEIHEDIVAGNKSAHRWTCWATFSGQSPLLPVPPTGKRSTATGSHVIHWEGDKAVEIWHYGDWLGWFQGFGVIPPLG